MEVKEMVKHILLLSVWMMDKSVSQSTNQAINQSCVGIKKTKKLTLSPTALKKYSTLALVG